MATVTHAFVNPKADGGDATIQRPSDWNAAHVLPVTTKGDIMAAISNNSVTRVPVGTDGQVLQSDSAQANGVSWTTPVKVVMAYKSADETVNNSAAMQDDDHLSFAIAANEVWAFDIYLQVDNTASVTPRFKFQMTVPASATGSLRASGDNTGAVDGSTTGANSATATGVIAFTATITAGIVITGVIINSSTAGTVHLQWAQNTAAAFNTIVKKGSWLRATKLA